MRLFARAYVLQPWYRSDDDFAKEAEILRRCVDCPFITRLVAFYDKSGPGSDQHLVMEVRLLPSC